MANQISRPREDLAAVLIPLAGALASEQRRLDQVSNLYVRLLVSGNAPEDLRNVRIGAGSPRRAPPKSAGSPRLPPPKLKSGFSLPPGSSAMASSRRQPSFTRSLAGSKLARGARCLLGQQAIADSSRTP